MGKTSPGRTGPTLPPDHEDAWRHYLRAHALLMRELDGQLRAEHGISLTTYDALVQLSEAPKRRLHMKDLADALVFSSSGLTRLVDGLERAGLAKREPDPDNRRATYVALTDTGLEALQGAWPTHASGVARLFVDNTTPAQARAIGSAFGRIRADLEGPGLPVVSPSAR
jgi:DNA-binding MarR family transcriptional regulator